VLLDTGAIVSLLDSTEGSHRACVEAIEALTVPLVTCEAVIAESCYLLRRLPGAAVRILENVTSGAFQLPLQLSRHSEEIQRIFNRYRDREVDLADACLIHMAGEFGTGDILTLDADFDIYRWGRNHRFHRLITSH
jgi:predicted nucleic acid-binding protein